MDAQRGIARRTVIGLPPTGLDSAFEKDFSAFVPAAVILFRRDFQDLEALRRLTARLRELARPRRLFLAVDEEGGTVSQLAGHLVVPPNAMLLGRGAHAGDIEWVSRITGERLRALGIDWVFAPVADIHSEPRNPVIGPRSFATSTEAVQRFVAAAVRGFQAAGVACCLKHFPGHGHTELDSHLALPSCAAERHTIEDRELLPFRENSVADSVMTAHVVYPALDPDHLATFSHAITTDLLRGTLGFEGVCVTDALEMKGAAAGRTIAAAGRLALAAGCDLLMWAAHEPELRRARLELARGLVDGAMDRASFDAARPRLARFDHQRPEPSAAELARPLAELTPPDWEARLETIIERGLSVAGTLPDAAAVGEWRIEESGLGEATLAAALAHHGVPAAAARVPSLDVIAIARRTPLAANEVEALRQRCLAGPTALVGLQNDGFLELLPEAALRISAADATPLTRRVVARRLAALRSTAAERRA